ncbi:1,4-alpha-glucan branching enzyme, partial [Xanthomonas perforans]|nr:1,4-alpha-glucan branching enzyme [Xanthomonas perforans]
MSERQGGQEQRTEADGMTTEGISETSQTLQALANGLPADAFAVLGPKPLAEGRRQVRVLAPGAEAMGLIDPRGKLLARMQASAIDGVFEGILAADGPYRLRIVWPDRVQEVEDPYAFAATLDESLLLQIAAGDGQAVRRALGAQHVHCGDVPGVRFAVWAPHAQRVAVVGDFNGWDVRRYPMRQRIGGFWELFLPRVEAGARYKYAVTAADGRVLLKADPVARQTELPPATASVVPSAAAFAWTDAAWMANRDPGP